MAPRTGGPAPQHIPMAEKNDFPSKQEVSRSLRYSVRDGVAYSVMAGAGETYFAAFALFLKATTAQVGLLSTLPPMIASLAQLLSAWLGQIVKRRRLIILAGTSLQAVSWIPLLLLPVIYPEHGVTLLIVCVTVYYALGNLVSPQWGSLMGDLVHAQQRGRYFARRNRLMSVTNFAALVGAGIILHYFESWDGTVFGYAVIFVVAVVARLVSVYFLSRMVDPPGHIAAIELPTGKDWWRRVRRSNFLRFVVFFALMNLAVGIASPYFAVYMLRDLHLSYMDFMAITATSVLAQFLTLNSWGRISDAFGNRLILRLTGCVVPLLPVAWVVSENFWYLIGVQIIAGFFWAGFSLSAGNFLYDLVPAAKRVTYLAIHNVLAAAGVFIGATLGGLLATLIEPAVAADGDIFDWGHALYYVFLVSTLTRIIVVAIFLPRIKEVRTTRRLTASGLILRATRSPALAGLVFEFGGSRYRRKRERNASDPAR
ncbi:MAG: hypothetical protein FD165_1297 [Gammaproteobacteria bacterium]|nr:MAG: hypothetical protein FD165_1297 [Gammaproteobacteria bacterium]TND05796.1 MAG: hypothetical protein FD120_1009 [Gammaproteobacteria bacterium]